MDTYQKQIQERKGNSSSEDFFENLHSLEDALTGLNPLSHKKIEYVKSDRGNNWHEGYFEFDSGLVQISAVFGDMGYGETENVDIPPSSSKIEAKVYGLQKDIGVRDILEKGHFLKQYR